jgi:DNA-binding GntR family transcriptional regulator
MSKTFDISGTVRERAVRELRDRILTGALPAGTRVDLDAITTEFATSRTPVREALLELSFEGLVRIAPRSGITVIGITSEDVIDSFTILGVLTGQAAAWAAERVNPQ